MPLQLPQQPNDPLVPLPAPPADPPTLTDLHDAFNYKQKVITSAVSGHANPSTRDDIGRAIVYEHAVTHGVSAAAVGPNIVPPWFVPVQQQLNGIEARLGHIETRLDGMDTRLDAIDTRLDGIEKRLDGIGERLDGVERGLTRIDARSARTSNAVSGDGSAFEFEIIPFTDGTNPTLPPHNLPRLASLEDVNALSSMNARLYLIGYGVYPIPHNVAARRQLVRYHIGCRVLP